MHCFLYIFCNQNKAMKFCGFHIFLFYGLTLNSIHCVSYAFFIQQQEDMS